MTKLTTRMSCSTLTLRLLAFAAVCVLVFGTGCGTPEERARRKKVKSLIKSANVAQKANDLTQASKDIKEALAEAPDNKKAIALNTEIEIAIAKATAEKMKPEAAAKIKQIESLATGQGFAALVKAAGEIKAKGDAALDASDFESAMKQYKALVAETDKLVALDGVRKATAEKLQAVEQAAKAAEASRSNVDAAELWAGAKAEEEAASVLFEQGEFEQAAVRSEAAVAAFGKAKAWAEGLQSVRAVRRAFDDDLAAAANVPLEQFGGETWKKTREACKAADDFCTRGQWDISIQGWNSAREWLKLAIKDALVAAEIERKRQEHLKALANFKDAMAKAEEKLVFALGSPKTEKTGMEAVQAGVTILDECEKTAWYKLLLPAETVKLSQIRRGLHVESFHFKYPDLVAVTNPVPVSLDGLVKDGSRTAQVAQVDAVVKLELPLEVVSRKTGIRFRLIPAGTFTMGSSRQEDKEGDETRHEVTISKPFYMAVFEVTQGQWTDVGMVNNSAFTENGAVRPVEMVRWVQAREFCSKLNDKEGATADTYRLPTEAQWEYACKAGTREAFYSGNHRFDLERAGWCARNSKKTTQPAGGKQPNAWGLYDMLGNVWEWCDDGERTYGTDAVTDPRGSDDDKYRVMRGGSWNDGPELCRSANRGAGRRDTLESYDTGLRIIRVLP